MARIAFKAKAQTMHDMDGAPMYQYLSVPQFDRKHCDMGAFRSHQKYGAYANSDLFRGMLSRIRAEVFGGRPLRLDQLPAGVTADTSGFLVSVAFEV